MTPLPFRRSARAVTARWRSMRRSWFDRPGSMRGSIPLIRSTAG